METIHQRIRRLRKANGLKIQDLATATSVKNQSARQWEMDKGGTSPRPKHWEALAKVLGVTVPELVHGTEREVPARAETRRDDSATPVAIPSTPNDPDGDLFTELCGLWPRLSNDMMMALLHGARAYVAKGATHDVGRDVLKDVMARQPERETADTKKK